MAMFTHLLTPEAREHSVAVLQRLPLDALKRGGVLRASPTPDGWTATVRYDEDGLELHPSVAWLVLDEVIKAHEGLPFDWPDVYAKQYGDWFGGA